MATMMGVPIIGIVENMSYFVCDKCNEKHFIYGKSNIEEIANKYGIKLVCRIPMDKKLRELVDAGQVEDFEGQWLDEMMEVIDGHK